ncbi:MAG: aldo/keto reductase [Cyclobacteriaceae bacterium]
MNEKTQELSIAVPTYTSDYKQSQAFDNATRLVMGTSGLGGVWGGVKTEDSADAILYALENGVAAFDTAPSYADAQKVLGEALRQWKGDRPFVSTKVGRLRGEHAHDFKLDYSNEGITKTLHSNLETLGLDYVDLLFLHEPQLVQTEELPRILELLQSFKEQGLVRRIGIGGNMTEPFRPYMGSKGFEVVSGFLQLNACNLDAMALMDFFRENGVKYYNASILHFGLLATRLSTYKKNFEEEKAWLQKRDIAIAEDLIPLAEKYNLSLSELAQRYAFGIAQADRIVVGAKNIQQVEQTLVDWQDGPLNEFLFDQVTQLILKHY